MSILASFFGVQSQKNFRRDLAYGNFLQFFLIALVMVAILHLSIYGAVKFVLRDVEHQGGRKPVFEEHDYINYQDWSLQVIFLVYPAGAGKIFHASDIAVPAEQLPHYSS